MKKYIIIMIFGFLLTSCEDILDIKPTTFVSDAVIWEDKNLIDQFVANTYGSLLCGFNRCSQSGEDWSAAFGGNFDSGSDDFDGKFDSNVNQFNTSEITALSCPYINEIWTSNYAIIRKCNTLIEQLEHVEVSVLTSSERKRYQAEAHFLRAFCYFDLAKTFGKAPLIEHAQTLTEDLLVTPADFESLVSFISRECDAYANDLYSQKEIPDSERGHATKGAFLALKSRALLYLASPLNNPNNDLNRWEEAAKAADAVRQLNEYSIYKDGDEPYFNLFHDKSQANKEFIFELRFQFRERTHNIHMQWSCDAIDRGSWNGLYPTQNLVDAYEMSNGKFIYEDGSGYTLDAEHVYTNRDKRFEQTILHNGSVWETSVMDMHTVTADGSTANCKPTQYKARCGYGLRKFLSDEGDHAAGLIYGTWAQDNNWPFFRYAEILLNYAEAKNESLSSPDNSVYEAINEVRKRVDQPELPHGLSKEQMRERIKNERRIEFVLEEHRFFDLRRWKDANKLRETILGMEIKWDGTKDVYKIVEVEPRVFNESHYYLPIPQSEIEKNPLLAN